MNREEFIKCMDKADISINKEHVTSVIHKAISPAQQDGNPRGHKNLIIVMEELSELSKEISKELRGKGNKVSILEELADVVISIIFVQDICKISDDQLRQAVNVKIKRIEDVLRVEGEFK